MQTRPRPSELATGCNSGASASANADADADADDCLGPANLKDSQARRDNNQAAPQPNKPIIESTRTINHH